MAKVSITLIATNSAVKEKHETITPPRRAATPATRWVPPAQIDQCLAEECSMSSVNSESQAGSINPVASPAAICAANSCQRLATKTYERSHRADTKKPS